MDRMEVLGIEDVDGAFAGTLEAAGGLSRRGLIKGGGGVLGAGLLFGGFASDALAAAPGTRATDRKVLQFGLVLEYLGASFYAEALANGVLKGETLAYAKRAHTDEVSHVRFVKAALKAVGGKPAPKPTFDFRATTQSAEHFRATALEIERMCVRVLNGAGPLVSKDVLAGAGRLVSVEARQVAWISTIIGRNPAPAAFDKPLTAAQAKRRLAKTRFVVS
jgi:ferritin-like protein